MSELPWYEEPEHQEVLRAMRRNVRLALTGFIILALGIAGAFVVEHQLALDNCAGLNDVRGEVVTFIEGTVDRSRRNAQATLDSPTASDEQKQAATQNLEEIEQVLADARNTLKHADC
jgi:hypothetical protein